MPGRLLTPVRQARYRSTHPSLSKSPGVTLMHWMGADQPAAAVPSTKPPGLFQSSVGGAAPSPGHRPWLARPVMGSVDVTWKYPWLKIGVPVGSSRVTMLSDHRLVDGLEAIVRIGSRVLAGGAGGGPALVGSAGSSVKVVEFGFFPLAPIRILVMS